MRPMGSAHIFFLSILIYLISIAILHWDILLTTKPNQDPQRKVKLHAKISRLVSPHVSVETTAWSADYNMRYQITPAEHTRRICYDVNTVWTKRMANIGERRNHGDGVATEQILHSNARACTYDHVFMWSIHSVRVLHLLHLEITSHVQRTIHTFIIITREDKLVKFY